MEIKQAFKERFTTINTIRFILLLTPFTFLFFFSTTFYGYVSSKIIGLNTIIILSLILIISNIHKEYFSSFILENTKKLFKEKIFIYISIFVILGFCSMLNSKNIFTSLLGSNTRWEGFMTLFSVYIFFILTNIFFTLETLKKFFINIYVVSIIIFILNIIALFYGIERTSSIIGNPIGTGQFFLFNSFFALVLFGESKNKKEYILYTIYLIISILGIMLSGTRGVFVGFCVGFLAVVFLLAFSNTRIIFNRFNLRKISIGILILIITFSLILIKTKTMNFWQKVPMINRVVSTDKNDITTMSRIENNKMSLKMFSDMGGLKNTMIGIGQEQYLKKWFLYDNKDLYKYEQAKMDRAHNFIFDLLIMRGILGTLAFLYILYLGIHRSKKIGLYSLTITTFIIVSYFIQNLFAFDFYPTNILFIMIFIYLMKKYEI